MADATPTQLTVLSPPRHRCLACGTSCNGVYIEVGDEEVARIEQAAEALGVERPLEEGGLRFVDGACVFLGSDDLCEIHRRFGMQTKPIRCQQFPFVSVRAGDQLRAGIDPACATAWMSWRDGPIAEVHEVVTRTRPLHPSQEGGERALIGAASAKGATVAFLLHLLCTGSPGGPDLPTGFASRLIERLQAVDLEAILTESKAGRRIQAAMSHLPQAIASLEPARPPAWPALSPEQDAWAIEATRRMLFLRLAPLIPSVQGVALLSLAGAVVSGWADAAPDRFGPAHAGWLRLMRFRILWLALTPDAETMRWLATGA